jgi:hypothetical protein
MIAETAYQLAKKPAHFVPTYKTLDADIKAHQDARKSSPRNLAKILLKERISGRFGSAFDLESSPYLEYNAQTIGDDENVNKLAALRFEENLSNLCGRSVVWFLGEKSESNYHKQIDCRKLWCPVCGGKNGKNHKRRLHSVMERVDFNQYNLRQLVFTVPECLRLTLQDRIILSSAIKSVKNVVSHVFGSPQFDKKGHVKSYKLEKGVVFYFHAFGDESPGVYKPHFNIHIFEEKKIKLKLESSELEFIKRLWLKNCKK